jgi:hypothetical protein
MDRVTRLSLENCIKELDAVQKLVLSEKFTYEQIADWINELSWNISNILSNKRYNSDEFQHILSLLVSGNKGPEDGP